MTPRLLCFALLIVLLALSVSAGAQEGHRCGQCGELIEGAHFETGGVYYHPEHFRCAECGRRIDGPYTEYKGQNYHNDCFRNSVALRCALCGGIIDGKYVQDFWGNSYHLSHQGEAPVCDSCSRFISPSVTGGGVRYDDGRYICAICRPSSVTDIDVILDLIGEVAGHLKRWGMDVDYKGLKVHLVGRDQMKEIAGDRSNSLRGFTDYSEKWRLFGKSGSRELNIYLLYGMPRMELIGTIAHELAHVWQFNHGRFNNDSAFAEGSCNYAAYVVLGEYANQEAAFFRNSMVNDADPIYGDGFRRVRRYAEAEGKDRWLYRLRKKTRLPSQY